MAEEKKRDRKEYMRQYYQKRRAELLAAHKQWAKDNPETHRQNSKDYYERKKLSQTPGEALDALNAITKED